MFMCSENRIVKCVNCRHVRLVFISDIVRESARLTQPIGLSLRCFTLVSLAEGKSLAEIQKMFSCPTDITGMLIGAFRRAKDLLSQLRTTWVDMPEQYERYTELMKAVSRDEVEVVA